MTAVTWILIAVCISQSAIFSGLNLAFFSVSKLRLQIEVSRNNRHAVKVLNLRKDANFLLVTILWGNVGVNVLLALLSGSVLTGVMAFVFSTVIITIIGEIMPQAYFSRNALMMGSFLAPVIRFYQILLYPVAKPTALILDRWLGPEAIAFYKEEDIKELMQMHIDSVETDIGTTEGKGAVNFLSLDDIPIGDEGNIIDPASIITMEFESGKPVFPAINPVTSDEFLQSINESGKKWIIIVDQRDIPRGVIRADAFLRDALFNYGDFSPYNYYFHPVVLYREQTELGEVIPLLESEGEDEEDDVIDKDLIIVWGKEKRIITGTDILGRLLRGIVRTKFGQDRKA